VVLLVVGVLRLQVRLLVFGRLRQNRRRSWEIAFNKERNFTSLGKRSATTEQCRGLILRQMPLCLIFGGHTFYGVRSMMQAISEVLIPKLRLQSIVRGGRLVSV